MPETRCPTTSPNRARQPPSRSRSKVNCTHTSNPNLLLVFVHEVYVGPASWDHSFLKPGQGWPCVNVQPASQYLICKLNSEQHHASHVLVKAQATTQRSWRCVGTHWRWLTASGLKPFYFSHQPQNQWKHVSPWHKPGKRAQGKPNWLSQVHLQRSVQVTRPLFAT